MTVCGYGVGHRNNCFCDFKQAEGHVFPDAIIQTSGIKLKTYTGERIAVIGQMSVEVKHFQQQKSLPLVVVAQDGPAFLGRNWLEHLRLIGRRLWSLTVVLIKLQLVVWGVCVLNMQIFSRKSWELCRGLKLSYTLNRMLDQGFVDPALLH